MSNETKQTAVDVSELAFELYPFGISERNAFINGYNKAKEMEKEQIEIPTDEEIHEQAKDHSTFAPSFIYGAQWMRDKIQGGNK
jgi:hypothetical protein